jgi:hypothetical protein
LKTCTWLYLALWTFIIIFREKATNVPLATLTIQ